MTFDEFKEQKRLEWERMKAAGEGDEGPELSADDEASLDVAWQKERERQQN